MLTTSTVPNVCRCTGGPQQTNSNIVQCIRNALQDADDALTAWARRTPMHTSTTAGVCARVHRCSFVCTVTAPANMCEQVRRTFVGVYLAASPNASVYWQQVIADIGQVVQSKAITFNACIMDSLRPQLMAHCRVIHVRFDGLLMLRCVCAESVVAGEYGRFCHVHCSTNGDDEQRWRRTHIGYAAASCESAHATRARQHR